MAALVVEGLLLALPAQADLAVSLALPDPAALAPRTATVSAEITGDDPVLDYAWEGLDAWPPCQAARCPLALPLAGCRHVAVEVTGLSGATARAEGHACAADEAGLAPTARVRVASGPEGPRVGREVVAGAAAVRLQRLFVDGAEVLESQALLPQDEGCHALDLLVVDAAGRTGEDHQLFCASDVAPRARLFADPGGRVQAALQALCGDHRHPLGLALTRVEGAMVPDQGCGAFAETPWAFTRLTEVVEDPRGVRSTASLFVGRVPAEGPRTVPWAVVPSTVGLGANAGEVVGGEAPFALSGWLESEQLGRADITVTPGAERNFSFVVPDFGLEDTAYTLHLVARDARGARTETVFAVEVLPPGLDAGVYDGGGPIVAQSDSAACTAFGAEGAAPLALLLIALPWLGRRRRVCS